MRISDWSSDVCSSDLSSVRSRSRSTGLKQCVKCRQNRYPISCGSPTSWPSISQSLRRPKPQYNCTHQSNFPSFPKRRRFLRERHGQAAPQPAAEAMESVGMSANLLISIIDDDESAREAVVGLVRARGLTATECQSADRKST